MSQADSDPVPMRKGFAYIAFWQFMAFFMLIALIWVNEVLNLTAMIFGEDVNSQPNMFRGFLLTSAVLITAIVTVGHTYEQQKRVIRGMMTVCSYCKRVRLAHEAWEKIEEYVARKSEVIFTHGVCPECFEKHAGMIKNRPGNASVPSPSRQDGP
jgi:hypothetical protein